MQTQPNTPRRPPAHTKPSKADLPFRKMAFPKFKPAAVANKLLSQDLGDRNLQEVLFAGFCAWVLAPHCTDLRNCAMRITARRIYDEACDQLLGNSDRPAAKRWKEKDFRTFKKEIYDVLGGHDAMYECISIFDLKEELEAKSEGAEFVLRLAELWHYAIESGSVSRNKKLSIVKSKDLAEDVGIVGEGGKKIPMSARNVERLQPSWAMQQNRLHRLRSSIRLPLHWSSCC